MDASTIRQDANAKLFDADLASKPFKSFLEVLLATVGTQRSVDREPICGNIASEVRSSRAVAAF
jgi:hypothetical protein